MWYLNNRDLVMPPSGHSLRPLLLHAMLASLLHAMLLCAMLCVVSHRKWRVVVQMVLESYADVRELYIRAQEQTEQVTNLRLFLSDSSVSWPGSGSAPVKLIDDATDARE